MFTFSALISNIYWCGIVSHQKILMVWHVALAEIIDAAKAAPAAPVSTPMLFIIKESSGDQSRIAQWLKDSINSRQNVYF